MIKKLVFFISVIFCIATTAYADDFVLHNQKNYDAYTYTKMVDCYSYHKAAGKNFAPQKNYFSNTSDGVYVVYKNMNFGTGGASHIKLNYSTYGDYTGILEFRKNSLDGELLASFNSENNHFWYDPEIRTKQIINPFDATGRFDLYVVIKQSTFGNLYGFEFVKQQSAYEEINAYQNLDRYKGIPETSVTEAGITFKVEDPLLLGDDYSRNAEYYMNFEDSDASQIVVDVDAEIGGRMRVYQDCPSGELLGQFILSAGNGQQTFDVSEKISALKGTQNLCIVFENSVNLTFKNFYFVRGTTKKTIDNTVFTAENCDEFHYATDKGTYIGNMNLTGAWVKWEDVDFGDDIWPRKMTVSYGLGSVYHGSILNVRIDSPDGEIIAKANIDLQKGINWETPKTTVSPMIKGITGIHDVYMTIDNGEYLNEWKAGNIFSVDFEPVNSKYLITYNVTGYINDPQKLSSVLTFLNDDDNPEEIVYIMAAYTSDGKLIAYDYDVKKVYEGLNSFEKSLDYNKSEGDDSYTIKVFVWDENNTPLVKENNTVGEITLENNYIYI